MQRIHTVTVPEQSTQLGSVHEAEGTHVLLSLLGENPTEQTLHKIVEFTELHS